MLSIYAILEELRDKLAELPAINTCKIGIEAGLSPDDYPIIRIVPNRFAPFERRLKFEFTIYFGASLVESDNGLEAVYKSLIELDETIKKTIYIGNGYLVQWLDTVTDDDRLEHFKIFASRFEVVG